MNNDRETKEDEASLLRDLERHAGWKHLKEIFGYQIAKRQDALSDWSLICKTANKLMIDPRDYENIVRGEIRILKRIMVTPERIAENLEEELRENAREREETEE